jgi:hypothetical protein
MSLSTLTDERLHPYFEWCPGSTLDLKCLDVYREIAGGNPKAKKKIDHRGTAARLFHLGTLDSEGRDYLLKMKVVFDERIEIRVATKEAEKYSSTDGESYQWRWNSWRIPTTMEDRKRKADLASLTMSSPSTITEEDDTTMAQQQPAANSNQDRQNPDGSGCNTV